MIIESASDPTRRYTVRPSRKIPGAFIRTRRAEGNTEIFVSRLSPATDTTRAIWRGYAIEYDRYISERYYGLREFYEVGS